MIPSLSSQVVSSDFLLPRAQVSLTESKSYGGVALNDASQGLFVQVWRCYVDGDSIVVEDAEGNATVIFTAPGTTEVSLAFDQNMRPFIAFVQNGDAKFYWFDSQDGQTKITNLPAGSVNPRCNLDDKRALQSLSNDILLCYVRNRNLYMRAQRDRYLVEYTLETDIADGLWFFGMTRGLRLQWAFM